MKTIINTDLDITLNLMIYDQCITYYLFSIFNENNELNQGKLCPQKAVKLNFKTLKS